MNICVVGTGYVGLVSGACFADFGVHVTCVDKDEAKVRALNEGRIPIYEPGLEELVRKNAKQGRLEFTCELEAAVRQSLVIFIAVGTPWQPGGSADLSAVEEVAKSIGANMNGYKVVVTKSTVPAGTGKRIAALIREHQREPHPFDIASNPEFLREGSAIEDFMRPDRVVIGASSEQAVAIMKDLYRPLHLIETPFVITTVESSEMIKYASNAFLAAKISFINEVANLAELVGADVHDVARGMGLDKRIGDKFLHAGPGYGGSCFPKDTEAFLVLADERGYDFKLVRATIEVNRLQRQRAVEKIMRLLGDAEGKLVAVAGLSFKPNTDDMRDAPSVDLIEALQEQGARVRAYDPVAMDEARKHLQGVEYAEDEYALAKGADALVVVTEWNQFRMMDMDRIRRSMADPVLVDLRNCYQPAQMRALGYRYACTGRS